MKKVNISESANYMGENEEDDGKGFSKVPIEQINLNTEPISIINDFNYNFFDNNIKSYIRVFLVKMQKYSSGWVYCEFYGNALGTEFGRN